MAQYNEAGQVTQTLAPTMGLPLFIPPSSCSTSVQHHPYPNHSLRIHIEGPAIAIERLFPRVWNGESGKRTYSQRVGPELAQLTFRALYGREMRPDIPGDMVIRNEYLGWMEQNTPGETREIGYYGVTFDHFVPEYDVHPDVFQLNLMEIENDGGTYANTCLWRPVDPAEYIGKKVLAVPRCCQNGRLLHDNWRLNKCFNEGTYGRIGH